MPSTKFSGFVGPSYKLDSVNVDSQRCVNLYPEIIESGTGKEAQSMYLKSTPGLTELFTVGDGPIRLIHIDSPPTSTENHSDRIFIISGDRVFKVEYLSGAWVINSESWYVGGFPIGTSVGPISAASSDYKLGRTIFADGESNYIYEKRGSTDPFPGEGVIDFFTLGYGVIDRPTQVLFVDGYYIYFQQGTNQFYVSSYNAFTIDPLAYASAEGDIDNIVGGIINHRYLIILNERSVEIWANNGNADFPFERVSGGFIEKGCLAAFSIDKIDGIVFWLGRDASGQGQIYAMEGVTPQRISTYAVEQAIAKYASPASATSYTYSEGGHSFYVINFAEMTWCYDLSTKMWHERAYTKDGNLERHRAESVKFFPLLGINLAGDYQTNKIYKLDSANSTDDGDPITRLRIAPHVSSSGNRLFHNSLRIDMQMGVGTSEAGQGQDPKAMLRFSDDGGHTWSNQKIAAIGKIGQYLKRLIFRRLGSSRDRVYELKITDPVPVTILSADIDIEQGQS